MSLDQIIQFFIKYKYPAIFPIAVAEGPIIGLVCGLLISSGHLDFIPTLLIIFFGDVVSDVVFYYVGKGGGWVIRYLQFAKVSPERLEKLEYQFTTAPWKTMIVAKVSYGLGTLFMIASGASRMSLLNFLKYILGLNFIRSFLLLLIGFYFGKVIIDIGPAYIEYYVIGVIIIVPLAYFLYHKFKKSPQNLFQ